MYIQTKVAATAVCTFRGMLFSSLEHAMDPSKEGNTQLGGEQSATNRWILTGKVLCIG